MNWWFIVMKKYSDFGGRASRSEYWFFVLFTVLLGLIALWIDNMITHRGPGLISFLFNIAILLPTLAVTIRRLHDIGKSYQSLFIGMIPLIGTIWLIVYFASDGELDQNEYGPNPKFKK
jgi:uncharacterized membrane protein YhaH (DUF805 family)